MDDKVTLVFEAMKKAGKPVRTGEIVEVTGIDKKEVTKIISLLKKEGRVISPKRCYYAPAY